MGFHQVCVLERCPRDGCDREAGSAYRHQVAFMRLPAFASCIAEDERGSAPQYGYDNL